MRRLVAISNKTSKTLAALVAITLLLTSIHMAAAARISALKRQQENLEKTTFSKQPSSALSTLSPASDLRSGHGQKSIEQQKEEQLSAQADASLTATHQRKIVISIADRKLAIMEDGQVLKIFPIAVGAESTPSPDGDFVIINHAKDPIYRHAGKEIAPGKDNPLGSRWMGLSLKGYGIHGTNVQSSVGKAASHGCFRMRKNDIEELYSLVHVGDSVLVRRERDDMIAEVFAAPAVPAMVLAVKAQSADAENNAQIASAATSATVETNEQ